MEVLTASKRSDGGPSPRRRRRWGPWMRRGLSATHSLAMGMCTLAPGRRCDLPAFCIQHAAILHHLQNAQGDDASTLTAPPFPLGNRSEMIRTLSNATSSLSPSPSLCYVLPVEWLRSFVQESQDHHPAKGCFKMSTML